MQKYASKLILLQGIKKMYPEEKIKYKKKKIEKNNSSKPSLPYKKETGKNILIFNENLRPHFIQKQNHSVVLHWSEASSKKTFLI